MHERRGSVAPEKRLKMMMDLLGPLKPCATQICNSTIVGNSFDDTSRLGIDSHRHTEHWQEELEHHSRCLLSGRVGSRS